MIDTALSARIRRLAARGLSHAEIACRALCRIQTVERVLQGSAVASPSGSRDGGPTEPDRETSIAGRDRRHRPEGRDSRERPAPEPPVPVLSRKREKEEAAIAAFLVTRGPTRCPTKFVAPSEHAAVADSEAAPLLKDLVIAQPIGWRTPRPKEAAG